MKKSDLLDDYTPDTEEIDLVHARISSIPSLSLSRFTSVTRLCLRQNSITEIEGLSCLAATLTELDRLLDDSQTWERQSANAYEYFQREHDIEALLPPFARSLLSLRSR